MRASKVYSSSCVVQVTPNVWCLQEKLYNDKSGEDDTVALELQNLKELVTLVGLGHLKELVTLVGLGRVLRSRS